MWLLGFQHTPDTLKIVEKEQNLQELELLMTIGGRPIEELLMTNGGRTIEQVSYSIS